MQKKRAQRSVVMFQHNTQWAVPSEIRSDPPPAANINCLPAFFLFFFFFSFYLLHNLIKFNRTRNFRTFLKKLSAKVHSSLSLYIFVFSFYLLNNKEKKVKVWVKSRCQRDVVPCPVSNMSSVFNVMAERPKECGKNHLAG